MCLRNFTFQVFPPQAVKHVSLLTLALHPASQVQLLLPSQLRKAVLEEENPQGFGFPPVSSQGVALSDLLTPLGRALHPENASRGGITRQEPLTNRLCSKVRAGLRSLQAASGSEF